MYYPIHSGPRLLCQAITKTGNACNREAIWTISHRNFAEVCQMHRNASQVDTSNCRPVPARTKREE